MLSRLTAILLSFLLVAASAWAEDTRSWSNLEKLPAGNSIEVITASGTTLKGSFLSVSDESIRIRTSQQEMAVARAEVSRVRRRPGSRATWIGAGIGVGAGTAIGYAGGTRLANESGGDFGSLRPAATAAGAVAGALVGALIGHFAGGRQATVYRSK